MQFQYYTENLVLSVLDESAASMTLDFLTRNHEEFSKWDCRHPEEFLTLEYQRTLLDAEQRLFLRSNGVRFYIFLKSQPDFILGCVSFAYLNDGNGYRCSIGYKTDKDFRKRGYAYEAVSFLIPVVMKEYGVKRIEADIMPDNLPSRALIEKLGFSYEGIARKSHEVNGIARDHCRYSILAEEVL